MANAVKWSTPAAIVSVLTTELNALGNNTLSALGPAYDNATNKNQYIDIELVLASLTPTSGGYVALYAALAVDGTNYGDAKRESLQQLIGIFSLDTATAAKRTSLRNILLPPELMKFYVDNQAGVALGATLNTVKVVSYNPEIQ
jgi:hypothetical protein